MKTYEPYTYSGQSADGASNSSREATPKILGALI